MDDTGCYNVNWAQLFKCKKCSVRKLWHWSMVKYQVGSSTDVVCIYPFWLVKLLRDHVYGNLTIQLLDHSISQCCFQCCFLQKRYRAHAKFRCDSQIVVVHHFVGWSDKKMDNQSGWPPDAQWEPSTWGWSYLLQDDSAATLKDHSTWVFSKSLGPDRI